MNSETGYSVFPVQYANFQYERFSDINEVRTGDHTDHFPAAVYKDR